MTLDALRRYEAKIRGLAAPEPSDGYALERIQGQRAWLERHPGLNTEGLSELRSQAIHGDYNETNLFLDGEGVCGIIDWDGTFAAPREWELMRTMHLVFAFDGPRCRTFLEAYRSEEHLDPGELDIGAQAYGIVRAHGFWLWEDIYDRGNHRLRRFLKPGGFVPVAEQWAELRASLGL